MKQTINVFWFRRDLRLIDNAGLFYALQSGLPVLPIFIFDKQILSTFPDPLNAQVSFIHQQICQLNKDLQQRGSSLRTFYSTPIEVFRILIEEYTIKEVFVNSDYEHSAIARDLAVTNLLTSHQIHFHSHKDQVIFEKLEVSKADGTPYTVFTPYANRWRISLTETHLLPYPSEDRVSEFIKCAPQAVMELACLSYQQTSIPFPPATISDQTIENYTSLRDYPASNASSRLGVHLRFGTISIRKLMSQAMALSEKSHGAFVNELIWREFYQSINWNFPRIEAGKAFKPKYDNIQWRNNIDEFSLWCNGQTGYPIVDAGIRQLRATGFMHNRVRMITASFLIKHLLIDWRWGEAFFANHLLDFDFAANNGGWQWAAGSGCDAVPYFRVFNPDLQTQKFDKDLEYIKTWVPEFQTMTYAKPIVEHRFARERALSTYKLAMDEL